MRSRSYRRHSAAALALAGLAFTAAGCNGDSNAEPEPLPSSSSTSPSSPTTSPTPTPTGWESEFSEEQLAEYETALGLWEDYERESAPIWADPKPNAETLKFFASYFYAEDLMQQRLEDYANAGIVVTGSVTVLSSQAVRIKGQAVTIRQCVDYTTLHVEVNGRPTPSELRPLRREIDLSKPNASSPYLITQVRDVASGEKAKSCHA